MDTASRDKLIETLWPEGITTRVGVWAIVDSARDPRIYGAVDGTYQDKACLFAGDLPWQLQIAAPYLVQLDREDRFTNYLLDTGWGNSWGVFLRTETSLRNLRNHLRQFLRVRDEAGRALLFRYYDPRVLRGYLPTCNREELRTVFGPVDAYIVESSSADTGLVYGFDGRSLSSQTVALGEK